VQSRFDSRAFAGDVGCFIALSRERRTVVAVLPPARQPPDVPRLPNANVSSRLAYFPSWGCRVLIKSHINRKEHASDGCSRAFEVRISSLGRRVFVFFAGGTGGGGGGGGGGPGTSPPPKNKNKTTTTTTTQPSSTASAFTSSSIPSSAATCIALVVDTAGARRAAATRCSRPRLLAGPARNGGVNGESSRPRNNQRKSILILQVDIICCTIT